MALFNKKELNYEDALVKLEKEGRKGFNAISSALLGGAVGVGAGLAAAGTIAGAAGATSIAGLTTAASWIGVTAVAATPVGWVVGSAAGLGAIGALGAAWWNQRTINAENAKMKIENIHEKINKNLSNSASMEDDEKFKQAINVLRTAHLQNLISEEQGKQLLGWLKENKITPEYAMSLIDQQCKAVEDSRNKETPEVEKLKTAISAAVQNKKISNEQARMFVGMYENKQMACEQIISMLKDVKENNTNPNELVSNVENTKIQQQVELHTKPVSGDDYFKQTIALLKSAMAENAISRDEGMQFLCKLRAKNIPCEEVISYLNNNARKV